MGLGLLLGCLFCRAVRDRSSLRLMEKRNMHVVRGSSVQPRSPTPNLNLPSSNPNPNTSFGYGRGQHIMSRHIVPTPKGSKNVTVLIIVPFSTPSSTPIPVTLHPKTKTPTRSSSPSTLKYTGGTPRYPPTQTSNPFT